MDRLLSPHVELVVAVPEKTRGSKNDERDAWARAEELRTGAIRTRVYKAPLHLAALRNAARAHGMAVQDVVRVKNRLKAVLRSRGILSDSGVYDPETRGRWLGQLPAAHQQLADWLGRELDRLEPLREEAEAWLLKEAKTHPIIRTLATAPGMGPIRTAQVVAITANPHRFRTRRQFWSYCGLGIVTHSSADWVNRKGRWVRAQVQQTRGLTRKRHPLLKSIFKGAATTVIVKAPRRSAPRGLRAHDPGRYQAELGQAVAGASDRGDGVVHVETPGGVRPEATPNHRPEVVGAFSGEADAVRWSSGVALRERFEGEHPGTSWSPGRAGEIPVSGYAPSEYPLKPWPHEALSGEWCPRIPGGPDGFELEKMAGQSDSDASRIASPLVRSRRRAQRPRSAIAGMISRPLQKRCGRMVGVFS